MQLSAVAGPSRRLATRIGPVRLQSTSTGPSRRRRQPVSISESGVDLVAPPDPISNIRPVIYASPAPPRRSSNSPYSAGEFPYSDGQARLQDLELEWRMRRERVDMANHRFWAATNLEFQAQLDRRLSMLPPAEEPPSADDIRRREDCLTQFYADWQIANRDKQAKWVKVWWREIWAGLKMQLRVHVARRLW